MEAQDKLIAAYFKSSDIFHDTITPKLPADIQAELKTCETFSYATIGGDDPKIILTVNGKEFDITQYWEPIPTIFDVYEY